MGKSVIIICSHFCHKKFTECLQIANTARQDRRRADELWGATLGFVGDRLASCQQTQFESGQQTCFALGGWGFGKNIFSKLKISICWTFLPLKVFSNPTPRSLRYVTLSFYPRPQLREKLLSFLLAHSTQNLLLQIIRVSAKVIKQQYMYHSRNSYNWSNSHKQEQRK